MKLLHLIPMLLALSCTSSNKSRIPSSLDDEGLTAVNLNYVEAQKFCKKNNARIPSAREWAQYAQKNGALGILEVSEIEKNYRGQAPNGYHLIQVIDESGKKDSFYYNNAGFTEPRNWSGGAIFWSSSLENSKSGVSKIGFMAENKMEAWFTPYDFEGAVLCYPLKP